MSAFAKLLDRNPEAAAGYWIGRHEALRDKYMYAARFASFAGVKQFYVREARSSNRALVKALKDMRARAERHSEVMS